MSKLQYKIKNEKKTVSAMIVIYCKSHHKTTNNNLCESCSNLLKYALVRIDKCVFGLDKPSCEKCPVHCYKISYRDEIKKIMRYSGPRMIFKHPILAIKHIIKNRKSKNISLTAPHLKARKPLRAK